MQGRRVARPGFPATLREFHLAFFDEAACARYLVASRWPDGFRCPKCDLMGSPG